jgi:hypothetical protein
MTKLHETTAPCPALAQAILPNGQTLFCQFDSYDELKNFQIESGGKPCLVQYDRDNNVKLIQHDYTGESLDWTKEWEDYDIFPERPWWLLELMFNSGMNLVMTELFNELRSDNWQTETRKRLINFDVDKREFHLVKIQYPVVNQTIGQGLNESMGVIV